MSTHNLCFEQKYEKKSSFLSENFPFLVVKFSVYLNRRVFIMVFCCLTLHIPVCRISGSLVMMMCCSRTSPQVTSAFQK